MRRNRNYYILVITIGIIIGLIYRYYSEITINTEVNLLDLITLIITIILAFSVVHIIEKSAANDRCQKDILIERLKVIDNNLNSLNQLISDAKDPILLDKINSILLDISTNSQLIDKITEKDYQEEYNQFTCQGRIEELDVLCTDDSTGKLINSFENGQNLCLYDNDLRNEIINSCSVISKNVFEYIIAINKA